MKIAVGSDHRGRHYKDLVKAQIERLGHTVLDMGTSGEESVDYPDHAHMVARSVAGGGSERGVLVCSTGIGMSMAANRLKGVRAALCMNREMAQFARRHNNSNVLCLGQDMVPEQDVAGIVSEWLFTEFEGGRHVRRVNKIDQA
ncbi:MAG: ribose 5-phosphate isomerase B [Candidatus Brocadiia bacterium]|nr:ribose 5-phosphate isomerase B [Candidatus Brocadiia bacterium]